MLCGETLRHSNPLIEGRDSVANRPRQAIHGADTAALEAGLAAERAVIAGAPYNDQRTGAPFSQRLEELVTSAEARAIAEELWPRVGDLEVTARHRAARA